MNKALEQISMDERALLATKQTAIDAQRTLIEKQSEVRGSERQSQKERPIEERKARGSCKGV